MTDLDRLDVLAAELDGWPDTTILATADGNASVTVATIRSLVAENKVLREERDAIIDLARRALIGSMDAAAHRWFNEQLDALHHKDGAS